MRLDTDDSKQPKHSGLRPEPRPSLRRGGLRSYGWVVGGWQAPPSIGRPEGCHTGGGAASGTAACTPTAGAALLRTPDRRRSLSSFQCTTGDDCEL